MALLALAGLAWHLVFSSAPEPAGLEGISGRAERTAGPQTDPDSERLFQTWAQDPDEAATQELVKQLLLRRMPGPPQLLEKVAAAYEEDPERYRDAMNLLAEALFQNDPESTLGFLSRLHGSPGIVPLERDLMKRWVADDAVQVAERLRETAKNGRSSPLVQFAFLASICQQERQDQLHRLAAWVSGLGEEDAGVKVLAIQSLVETSGSEGFPAISALFTEHLEDPAMAAWAARLAARQAAGQPEAVLDWIRSAPAGAGRMMMLEDVMGGLSSAHPELAVELINDPAELADLFGMPDGPPQESLQDRALARYLDVTMYEAPDHALELSGIFHDSERAAAYGEKARQLLEAKRH